MALLWLSVAFCQTLSAASSISEDMRMNAKMEYSSSAMFSSSYPWHKGIVTTVFWIGNNKNSYTTTVNYDSAWDMRWHENYGGDDDPKNRTGSRPKNFFPKLNPFYIALPFNDVAFPAKAAKLIPWYKKEFVGRFKSVCKDRWVAIHNRGRFCYASWQDVGPFRVDNAEYVFGNAPPNTPTGAGLDVSPAVRDYLRLSGKDRCDWRFIESNEIPFGPWISYGELSFILGQIGEKKKKGASLPKGAENFNPAATN